MRPRALGDGEDVPEDLICDQQVPSDSEPHAEGDGDLAEGKSRQHRLRGVAKR